MTTPCASVFAALAVLVVAGCSPIERSAPAASGQQARQVAAGERAYRTPPSVIAAEPVQGPRIRLEGIADPGERIRLATPSGLALFARADPGGLWRIAAPPSSGVRLFGLSMTDGRQTVQSESYLALTPGGTAVRLRSGAGAVVLDGPCVLCLTALDVDRKGGAVISGRARPAAVVDLAVDGTLRGRVAADGEGRYWLDLDEPLGPGTHRLQAAAGDARAAVVAELQPPAPLTGGPFVAGRTPSGWRIEWVTPGGGIQTTLVFDRGGPAA